MGKMPPKHVRRVFYRMLFNIAGVGMHFFAAGYLIAFLITNDLVHGIYAIIFMLLSSNYIPDID